MLEAAQQTAATEDRRLRNARRRYLNTIAEAGVASRGKSVPDFPNDEHFDGLCDFFSRAVVWPGQIPADADGNRPLKPNSMSSVPTQLLTAHLNHHCLQATRTHDEVTKDPD